MQECICGYKFDGCHMTNVIFKLLLLLILLLCLYLIFLGPEFGSIPVNKL